MKAIWGTCARAFSLPGMSKKRDRGDKVPDLIILERKRVKVDQKNDGMCTDRTDAHDCADHEILNLRFYLSHN